MSFIQEHGPNQIKRFYDIEYVELFLKYLELQS